MTVATSSTPDSALGRRLQWLVDALGDPSAVSLSDIEQAYDASDWVDWSPERELEFFERGRHAPSRPYTVESMTTTSDTEGSAILAGGDGKRWSVECRVEPGEPHRITGARVMPAPPPGTTIRLARPDDGAALAELERNAPIRLGPNQDTLMTFDHGDDYFAPGRLMEDVTIYVAEVHGVVAGVYCGAVQPVLHDGEPKRLFLEHHVRIDPTTARGGVFWALCNFGRDAYARSTDSIAFYVSVDNHALRKYVEGVPPWSVQPLRALIPCAADVSTSAGSRAATPDDANVVCEALNACHEGSGLFVPYDSASLASRLERDGGQYGWSDVRILGSAVAGIGRRHLGVTISGPGRVATSRRALVLDHGFSADGEDDYRRLLMECGAMAGARGATHLAVFTSERSATYPVVSELAEEVEPFDFWAFNLSEPAELGARGFYVDPVYF